MVGLSSGTSTGSTNGNEPCQGNGKATSPVRDASHTTGTRDHRRVHATSGDGVPIVLCVRESRRHGEGAHGVFLSLKQQGAWEMRSSATVLERLHDRGTRGVPVTDLSRQRSNPPVYLRADGRMDANEGAMTAGSTSETADAMTLRNITTIIDDLRQERSRWTPVRRTSVPKKHGKKRTLGFPSVSDTHLQEVIRRLLEASDEPQFSEASHGCRPQRGCHTALSHIERMWKGTHWFREGDITACVDHVDHQVL